MTFLGFKQMQSNDSCASTGFILMTHHYHHHLPCKFLIATIIKNEITLALVAVPHPKWRNAQAAEGEVVKLV